MTQKQCLQMIQELIDFATKKESFKSIYYLIHMQFLVLKSFASLTEANIKGLKELHSKYCGFKYN